MQTQAVVAAWRTRLQREVSPVAEIPIERKPRSRTGLWVLLLILLLVAAGVWYWWSSQPVVTQTGFIAGPGRSIVAVALSSLAESA